ncbi:MULTISPECIES: YitT family protein [unclassified Microbacterium]|uniref:membrane protein YczE n=1 Tax=unclassified Microbacterium TaxID=2609290 RepID=UPI0018DFA47A
MTKVTGRRLPRRILQLVVGVFLFGLGISFMIRAGIGAAPWDVLAQGIALRVPLSFGTVSVILSLLVLLLWIPLRQRPGIGTIVNALGVGVAADVGFLIIPEVGSLWLRILSFATGLTVLAVGSGLYIGAHFGPGPRDGLMTGLHARLGWPIWLARTVVELSALVAGWLLGGVVGLGTVAFALLVGPMCQFFLTIFAVRLDGGESRPPRAPRSDELPAVG